MAAREKKMKTPKHNLLPFLSTRETKCKFIRSCNLYSNASYTCMHVGGEYCGKYRTLNNKLQGRTDTIINEDFAESPLLV